MRSIGRKGPLGAGSQLASLSLPGNSFLDIAIRARRAVIAGLAQGIVGVDSVASSVGLSKRTLNRRLAERGTSNAARRPGS